MQTIGLHEHLNLAYAIARDIGRCRHDLDDLVSERLLGLVEARHRYDHAYGVPFRSYARIRVRGRILDYIDRERRHRHEPLSEVPADELVADPAESPEHLACNRELLSRVLAAANDLSPLDRFLAHAAMLDEPEAPLARQLGIPRPRVSRRTLAACRGLCDLGQD